VLHDEFVISALPDQLLLAAVLKPHHRAALTVLVDEGEQVLQFAAPMKIEEFRHALCIAARQRMCGNIVDPRIADPDLAPVIE
jgi:hypothetical protein